MSSFNIRRFRRNIESSRSVHRLGRRGTSGSTYAGAKGCRAVAAAAAASGPGFLARANAAALVGNVALAAPTLPRWIATPLNAAAVTTHTNMRMLCLPCWRFSQRRWIWSLLPAITVAPFLSLCLLSFYFDKTFGGICQPKATTRRDLTRFDEFHIWGLRVLGEAFDR